jgi:hypothetical protein
MKISFFVQFVSFIFSILISQNAFPSEDIELNDMRADAHELPTTSKDFRKNLKFTATVQPAGFGPIPEFSQGVNLGYSLNPDSILQLELTRAENQFKTPIYSNADGYSSSTSSQRWYSSLKGYSIGIHIKEFIGNSFYLNGGIDYRNLSRDNEYDDQITPAQSFDVGFSGSSIAAAVSLGNQFQYSHFTMGCDWVGVSMPFSHSVQGESAIGPVTDVGLSTRQNDEARYLSMPTIQLLRVYLGASF